MAADDERILNGEEPSNPGESENAVKELPENFNKWVADNEERIGRAKSLPYFLRDNDVFLIADDGIKGAKVVDRLKSMVNHLTHTEDTAAEQAATPFTEKQKKNHEEVSKAIGVEQGERMSFIDADSGKANPKYSLFSAVIGEENEYNNCTMTVVTHELRMRGWDVTALQMDSNKKILHDMMGGSTNKIWINPKTKQPPTPKVVSAKTYEKTMKRFEEETASVGRYHFSFKWEDGGGHIMCVDRLPNGELRFYDPQSNILNVDDWSKRINLKEGIKVTKVDGMMINTDFIGKLVAKR